MSEDETETEVDLEAVQDCLAEGALAHVPFDGWSMETLRAAALDAGFDETMAERAFPGGAVEAVARFCDLADRRMIAEAEAADLETMRIDARVAWVMRHRLEPWDSHRESIRRAIALLALPSNTTLAAKLAWRTADSIWYAAKDKSADFSYYTKRAMVMGIFSAATMYWLADTSEESADTWAFIDRRLADALKITKLRQRLTARLEKGGFSLLKGGPKRRFGIRG